MSFHEFYQANPRSDKFPFPVVACTSLIHFEKNSNCWQHKYDQSISRIFYCLFLAGFCYLAQLWDWGKESDIWIDLCFALHWLIAAGHLMGYGIA